MSASDQDDDRSARVADYGDVVERLNATGKWWVIGKGQIKRGEKLWGCLIQEPKIDGATIARAEAHDLLSAAWKALSVVESKRT